MGQPFSFAPAELSTAMDVRYQEEHVKYSASQISGRSRVAWIATIACVGLTAGAHAGTNPPVVNILFPVGGEVLSSGTAQTIRWTATDDSGFVVAITIEATFDGGATWLAIARDIENLGELTWYVHNRPAAGNARIRITALDPFIQTGVAVSNPFTVLNGSTARVRTTARDFDLGGTQPLTQLQGQPAVFSPAECKGCHGGGPEYPVEVAPYNNWRGSMMSYSSIDPLFLAALDVAERDAAGSGETCIRCHTPAGWLGGRSNPSDGSQLLDTDKHGVSCDICHRMVDPIYQAGVSPIEDVDILAAVDRPPLFFGGGQFVIDPDTFRKRGPFEDALAFHGILYSPHHRESEMCATCHLVSNPAFVRSPEGTYPLHPLDQPIGPGDQPFQEQSVYTEWLFSDYNTPQGVFAPDLGGNRQFVSSCQDCHMRDITGRGCFSLAAPLRQDQPLHDLSGGSTWMLSIMHLVDTSIQSDPISQAAIARGIERARYMLQHAAAMNISRDDSNVTVRVTNRTGHRLPGGYPEGRRMWLNVKFFNNADVMIGEAAPYNPATGVLTETPGAKIWEAHQAIGADIAPLTGYPAGQLYHLALNNSVVKDNRIPPLGWQPAAYAANGIMPVGATYAAGQNWDDTSFGIPIGAVRAEVRLYYQSVSKEYIDELRASGTPGGPAETMFQLWNNNGKAPPELMLSGTIAVPTQIRGDMNCDGVVNFNDIDGFVVALVGEAAYEAAYPNCAHIQADTSQDMSVDFGDIDSFIAALIGG